jgi:hypothetical protein
MKYVDYTINAPKGSNVITCHRNHNDGMGHDMQINMVKSMMKHNLPKMNKCLIPTRKQLPLYNTTFQNAQFFVTTQSTSPLPP